MPEVELLGRNSAGKNFEELRLLLHELEVWCADLLESHLSYPVLAYYRSQHEQQSWVEALTVILDTCALLLTCLEDAPLAAARFTFVAARHTVVDLAQLPHTPPRAGVNLLSSAEWTQVRERLKASGFSWKEATASEQELAELRATYEPFVSPLADLILVSLPPGSRQRMHSIIGKPVPGMSAFHASVRRSTRSCTHVEGRDYGHRNTRARGSTSTYRSASHE